MQQTLGFLGVGHFASYTIKALRCGGYTQDVWLSPRNSQVSENLARTLNCRVAALNQQVVEQADVLVLAVRPDALPSLMADLTIPQGKTIVSALAGIATVKLREYLPENPLLRIMPSSFIEAGDGIIPMYPRDAVIKSIFSHAGEVVEFADESDFDRSVVMACAYAWNYRLMDQMIQWFEQAGWPKDVARKMVVGHIRGATTYAQANPELALEDILSAIATPGTFTRLGLDVVQQQAAFTPWLAGLEAVDNALDTALDKTLEQSQD